MPGVLLLLALVVQAGLYYHSQQRAEAAADRAATVARVAGGDVADAEAAARAFLAGVPLDDSAVRVDRADEQVEVTVSGVAPRLVPGFSWRVQATVHAPVERFVPEDER